jgi:hypothetical protein
MLALGGLTPSGSTLKSQLPGSSSLLPPVKAVSWSFSSEALPVDAGSRVGLIAVGALEGAARQRVL